MIQKYVLVRTARPIRYSIFTHPRWGDLSGLVLKDKESGEEYEATNLGFGQTINAIISLYSTRDFTKEEEPTDFEFVFLKKDCKHIDQHEVSKSLRNLCEFLESEFRVKRGNQLTIRSIKTEVKKASEIIQRIIP